MKRLQLTLSLLILSCTFASAQNSSFIDTSITIPLLKVGVGFQFPGQDMKERFGNNTNVEVGFGVKLKSNFFIEAQYNFMFGTDVKEDTILDKISTTSGNVIDNGGELGSVFLDQRGYAVFLSVGKIFPVISPNDNSGITVSAGVGFLEHKIRLEFRDSKIPQLTEEYRDGYDRLSNGMAFRGFIGYTYFANSRLINFYFGLDYMQAWTTNRRGFNFDSGEFDKEQRNDNLVGIKFGWILPMYKRKPKEFYYY